MLISLEMQFRLLIFGVLSGLAIGIFFDIYRIVRGFNEPSKIVTFIEDILFWVLTALIIFILLAYTSYGYMCIYSYLYIFLGFYFYMITLSSLFIKLLNVGLKGIFTVFRTFMNILGYPFQLLIYNTRKRVKHAKKNNLNKT